MTAETAILRAGVVRIGKCYSGLLHNPTAETRQMGGLFAHPDVLRRVAIATPRAFEYLERNSALLGALDRALDPSIIREAGLWPKIFEGKKDWTTVGLRFFDPPAEETPIFNEALAKIQDLSRGVHRTLYMALHGVEAFGIERLGEEDYKAVLGRLYRLFQDPKHQGLSVLTVSEMLQFDSTETIEGGLQVRLSLAQLRKETYRAYPSIKEKPIQLRQVDGKWYII